MAPPRNLAGELFKSLTALDIVHVPYRHRDRRSRT